MLSGEIRLGSRLFNARILIGILDFWIVDLENSAQQIILK